jgi:hypothetical protein
MMKKYRDGGIYTADMGKPPQDVDGGSAPPKKPAAKKAPAKDAPKKYAKGGSIDGCAVKGKTRGKMV